MSVRRTGTPTRSALVLLTCLVLALAGCAEDDPEPRVADPSPTPTPTASVSPVAEETPEEFIRRWAETEKQMLNTGETTEYSAITGPCESCSRLAEQVTSYYAAGGYVRWEGDRIRRITSLGEGLYEVATTSPPTEFKASRDGNVENLEGGRSLYRLTLEEREGELVLTDLIEIER